MAEPRRRNAPIATKSEAIASSVPKTSVGASSTSGSPQDTQADSFLDETWSWSKPSTWPWSIRLMPVVIGLLGIFVSIFWDAMMTDRPMDLRDFSRCASTFNYTFAVNDARVAFADTASRDWEYGVAAEAGLELLNRDRTVFASNPFPKGRVPGGGRPLGIRWATGKMWTSGPTLYKNEESNTDPAALGVYAVIHGKMRIEYGLAAMRQKEALLESTPRYANGAISHRTDVPELWSDAIFMFPPFLAFYAVDEDDLELLKETVRQCELYRDVLRITSGEKKGLWKHIVGPSERADEGAWSTGNGWAAFGLARVRATVAGWQTSREAMAKEIAALDGYLMEIIDGAIKTDTDPSGLLRNYLGDKTWFGEAAGTSLLAAATYRLALFLEPGAARDKYLEWAHSKRRAVYSLVSDDGIIAPVVNPHDHGQREPLNGTSSEAQSFLWLMGAAWRDCVCTKVCQPDATQFDRA